MPNSSNTLRGEMSLVGNHLVIRIAGGWESRIHIHYLKEDFVQCCHRKGGNFGPYRFSDTEISGIVNSWKIVFNINDQEVVVRVRRDELSQLASLIEATLC